MASQKAREKRNRNGSPHKWHKKRKGGKTYAEKRGVEMKIAELEADNAKREHKLGLKWNPVAYTGNKQFSAFWNAHKR